MNKGFANKLRAISNNLSSAKDALQKLVEHYNNQIVHIRMQLADS